MDNLIVHSRDNCLRNIEITNVGHRILTRYFGSSCSKYSIHSAMSPDG